MELLDFYAKILPDQLFMQEREKRKQPKWLGDTYTSLLGSELRDVSDEADRIRKETKDVPECGESGAYTMLLGCHIPVRGHSKQPNIERFLGDDDPILRFRPKREVENMFGPEFGIRQNNVSLDTDQLRQRLQTTTRTNDGKDIGVRVGPGLGRAPGDNSQRGMHPLLRIIPKEVNQLRSWLTEKITYQPQQRVGQLGKRSIDPSHMGLVEKRTADTFTDRQDLTNRIRASQTAPKLTGQLKNTPTQRGLRSDVVSGPVRAYDKHSQYKLDKFTEETIRNEYREPDPMQVSNPNAGVTTTQNSYALPTTQRMSAVQPPTGHASAPAGGEVAVNFFDIPRDTQRQQVAAPPKMNLSAVQKASPQYSVAGFTPAPTIRDTTSLPSRDRVLRGVAGPTTKGRAFDPQLQIRDTLKGSLPVEPFSHGAHMPSSGHRSFDPNDVVQNTIRQTTSANTVDGQVRGASSGYRSFDPTDVLQDTIRQTTSANTVDGHVRGPSSQHYLVSHDFNPRDSVRETTQVSRLPANPAQAEGGESYTAESVYNRDSSARATYRSPQQGAPYTAWGERLISKDAVPENTTRETTQTNNYKPAAWRLEAQGGGYRATGVESAPTQRQLNPDGQVSSGASHASARGPSIVERSTIQLNECRDQNFAAIHDRPQTKIGNASFPNKSTVVGSIPYLRPDGDVVRVREVVPLLPIFETPGFTNETTSVVQDRDPERNWRRLISSE